MCDPFSITALALTAAGTATQYYGQKQAQKAMSAAANAESKRQQKLRDEAQGLFEESLGKQDSEAQTKRLADAQAEREAATVGNMTDAAVVSAPVQGGTPSIVADETEARVGEGNIRARDEALAKAALASFGDLQLGNALMNARYGAQQGQLGNFMQGSQAVLPTEMAAASRKGEKTRLFGDLLVAGGQIAGMAGLANGAGAFGSTAGQPKIVAQSGLKGLGGTIPEVGSPAWMMGSPEVAYGGLPRNMFANPTVVKTPYKIPLTR